MNNFYEFASAHPIVTVVLAVVIAGIPSSIIRALKGPRQINLNLKNQPNHDDRI